MSSTPTADWRHSAAPAAATRPYLKRRARKAVLAAHVLVSSTWLGAVIANLFLGISAAATSRDDLADAYYVVMDRLVNNLMPAAAIATLATGLLLSLATRWGLLRHCWIVAKFILAIATVVVGVAVIDGAIQETIAARAATHAATTSDLSLPAIIATPAMLASATTLAITKPWGQTMRRQHRTA
jgi:uncharacterized membrane protein